MPLALHWIIYDCTSGLQWQRWTRTSCRAWEKTNLLITIKKPSRHMSCSCNACTMGWWQIKQAPLWGIKFLDRFWQLSAMMLHKTLSSKPVVRSVLARKEVTHHARSFMQHSHSHLHTRYGHSGRFLQHSTKYIIYKISKTKCHGVNGVMRISSPSAAFSHLVAFSYPPWLCAGVEK